MSERARAGVWPRRLANAYLLAVALFAAAVAWHAAHEHLTDLFVDDWRILDHYQSLPLAAYLTTPENGHHIPLTLALFALDHELFGGRMHLLVALAVVCLGLAFALVARGLFAHDRLASPTTRLVLGFAAFALAWAASCHDLLWGLNQDSPQAVALVVLALLALGRVAPGPVRAQWRPLALAGAAAIGATLSQAVGVASWAALVGVAVVRRLGPRVVAGLAVCGALVVGLFAASIPPHPKISFADSLAFATREPLALAELGIAFVGGAPARVASALGVGAAMPGQPSRAAWSAHTKDLYRLALGFGGVGLVLFALIAFRRWRRPLARSQVDALAVGLMAFGLGGAALVGFARASLFGPAAVVQTRFVTWSALFWIGAVVALLPRDPARAASRPARCAALLLPLLSLAMLPALREAHAFHATRVVQARKLALSLQLGLRDAGLARRESIHEAELVFRVADRLREQGRPPFDGPRRDLRGAPLSERFADAGVCAGALERARRISGTGAIEVWGWIPAEAPTPAFVVLADAAGAIRGLAEVAAAPASKHAGRVAWSGFVAEYDAGERYTAWAISADQRDACRLTAGAP